MNKQITDLLNKKMDRGAFLKHIGLAMLVLLGVGSLIKMLSSGEQNTISTVKVEGNTNADYGKGLYGR